MPRQKKQRLKRRPDGRYCCVYHGVFFYGSTEEEALLAREDYKRREAAGEYIAATGYTVRQYAEKWLPLHKSGVSPKCYNDYKKQLDALIDAVGDTKLDSLTVDDAATVWEHFRGYSESTIHRARMLYVSLFDTAIENDLCKKNPYRQPHAQPPKGTSGSHRCLTDEEVRLIQTTPHRVQLAALIMLYAGLRRGEVLALTRQDITPDEIIVNKAIRFVGNRPTVESPKTDAGTRRVPILSILRPALQNAPQRILIAQKGGEMTDTAFKRAWDSYNHALTLAAGHPVRIRPHDLRHTYCTMLRDAGVDMHQAMLWMGHADEKMILRIYDHVTNTRTQKSISQVETMLIHSQNDSQPPEDLTKSKAATA